jgi:hypothetical protein
MHQLYPEHAKALQHAGLSGSRFSTLKQVLDSRSGALRQSRSHSGKKSQAVVFCLGDSRFWKTPIHVLLRCLRNKYNLLWLRVTMSYHCFNNLRAMFQGHLNRVLIIRNLNNAVMGFWTVQRGLIRQFFTHNTYNLICRQLFNPNMQADLP